MNTANTFGIAIVHTVFNVVTTAILLPFNRLLEKLAILTVPDSPADKKQEHPAGRASAHHPLRGCGPRHADRQRYGRNLPHRAFAGHVHHPRLERRHCGRKVEPQEDAVDHYEDVLGTYLVKLSAKHLSPR